MYDIALRIDIRDPDALTHYVKTFVPEEFGLRKADVSDMNIPEALMWLYDPGTCWPGCSMIDCMIKPVLPAVAATGRPADISFTLPGLIPWQA